MKKCKICGGDPYLLQGAVLSPREVEEIRALVYTEEIKFYQYSCSQCAATPTKTCFTEKEAKEEWENNN